MKHKVLLSWSSGKDSAWTLQVLQQQADIEIIGLLTSINEAANRVAMHAVRYDILRLQAEAAGLPLWPVMLPWPCSNADYEQRMAVVMQQAEAQGVTQVAFGDLFLEDVRDYRISQFANSALQPIFPLWLQDTGELARAMIDAGLVARVTCVDPAQLDADFAGRLFDHQLLDDLPDHVDPCGEHGEFHTCVLDGPMFRHAIPVTVGARLSRDGFCFADLLPVTDER